MGGAKTTTAATELRTWNLSAQFNGSGAGAATQTPHRRLTSLAAILAALAARDKTPPSLLVLSIAARSSDPLARNWASSV